MILKTECPSCKSYELCNLCQDEICRDESGILIVHDGYSNIKSLLVEGSDTALSPLEGDESSPLDTTPIPVPIQYSHPSQDGSGVEEEISFTQKSTLSIDPEDEWMYWW